MSVEADEARSSRSGPPCRKFTLMDGMILIAGLGVGFAGLRHHFLAEAARLGDRPDQFSAQWVHRLEDSTGFGLVLASHLWFVLRFIRPRPPIRRIMRQPGAIACFVVVATMMINVAESLAVALRDRDFGAEPIDERIWDFFRPMWYTFASVVPISWLGLALAGRWRPDRGWIDRSARLVGVGWILWFTLTTIFHA